MANHPSKRVIVEGDSLKKLQQERAEHIDSHLQELGKQLSIENQDLDMVLRAELETCTVPPTDGERRALLARCVSMAELVSRHKLQKLNNEVKGICKLLNVRDLPEHIIWSARRTGVELVDAEPAPEAEPH